MIEQDDNVIILLDERGLVILETGVCMCTSKD